MYDDGLGGVALRARGAAAARRDTFPPPVSTVSQCGAVALFRAARSALRRADTEFRLTTDC